MGKAKVEPLTVEIIRACCKDFDAVSSSPQTANPNLAAVVRVVAYPHTLQLPTATVQIQFLQVSY